MSVPKLTDEQRKEASVKATAARQERAALRARVHSGELSIEDVLDMRGQDVVDHLPVYLLVSALPNYGKIRTERLMDDLGISKHTRLKGLGIRQEQRLRERLCGQEEEE